ncbi:MAG: carbon monoxide dehydrogenase subunit G [Acidobacteria bacterium]|nr:carbon monoxide dehydrogenase subunit G [Acidobacteriota bacterium]
MRFEGQSEVKAPRERVWDFIINPHLISQCFPGLQKLEIVDANRFNATVEAGVSFIKGTFKVQSTMAESSPPSHARMVARGSGVASSVDVDTTIHLEERGAAATVMIWKADILLGGLIASVGSRLVAAATDKVTKELFERIRLHVER